MEATVRVARAGRNAPQEELPRPPEGGRRSSGGRATRPKRAATLDFVSLYTTAADRRGGRLAVLDAALAVAAFAATVALAWRGTAFGSDARGADWLTVLLA